MTDTGLDDFGAFDSQPPPRIQKQHSVWTQTGDCVAGHLGPVPQRNCWGFVKAVNGPDAEGRGHTYTEWQADQGGAYAVSADAFAQVRQAGAQRVLVVDHADAAVYEWPRRAWDGNDVPKSKRWDYGYEYVDDPQVFGVRDEARVWDDPGHVERVIIPGNVTLSGEYR